MFSMTSRCNAPCYGKRIHWLCVLQHGEDRCRLLPTAIPRPSSPSHHGFLALTFD